MTVTPVNRLAGALVAAQKEMPVVHKTAKANYGNYATLDAIIEKTRPVLHKHGLAISQFPTETTTGGPGLRTVLLHGESGETLEATVPLLLNGKNDMQALGGAITYARRYGWAAVLGIASDEDDDGNTVSQPAAEKAQAAQPPEKRADPSLISEPQQKRLLAIARENDVTPERVKELVKQIGGVEHTNEFPKAKYDELINAVQGDGVPF